METETVNNELDELMSSFKEEIEQSRFVPKKFKRFDFDHSVVYAYSPHFGQTV